MASWSQRLSLRAAVSSMISRMPQIRSRCWGTRPTLRLHTAITPLTRPPPPGEFGDPSPNVCGHREGNAGDENRTNRLTAEELDPPLLVNGRRVSVSNKPFRNKPFNR
eukprot:1172125-Prorocentrum_minimum.AAC.1